MATYTTNLNLKKPAQSDKIRIADINGNMDDIDAAVGDIGERSIAAQIGDVEGALAIVSTGNVHGAITSGQYVYIKNHDTLDDGLYVATTNISANGTLSSSNVTADSSGGGLNALNGKITPMGAYETIDANITADKTINHDFTKYRFVIIYYHSANFYRQFIMYPKNIVLGSNKWGYDNLLTTDRCYCLKTSGASTSSIDVAVAIPASGAWAGGHFEMYGIK